MPGNSELASTPEGDPWRIRIGNTGQHLRDPFLTSFDAANFDENGARVPGWELTPRFAQQPTRCFSAVRLDGHGHRKDGVLMANRCGLRADNNTAMPHGPRSHWRRLAAPPECGHDLAVLEGLRDTARRASLLAACGLSNDIS